MPSAAHDAPGPPPSTTAAASSSSLRRTAYEPVSDDAPDSPTYTHDLTLLSWNVLADGLAQTGRWAHCPPALLEWGTRAPALLAEVDAAGADVVCLQECNHYDDHWAPAMAARGYEGAFWAKPGSPAARAGAPPDGCAVFWRASRFTAASVRGEPFFARCVAAPVTGSKADRAGGPTPTADTGATDEEANGVGGGGLPQPAPAAGDSLPLPTPPRGVQGCLVVTLTDTLSGRPVVVACTHLKAKAGAEEEAVRARQAGEAVSRLREAAAAAVTADGRPPVLLLAGDFNAGPASPAAQAPLAAGLASVWEEGDGGGEGGGGRGGRSSRPTPWRWSTFKYRTAGVGGADQSAPDGGVDTSSSTPPPKASRGLVDHVFFRGADLSARWPPLEPEPAAGLPCEGYPSDHAAVAAVFRV
jgi:nocturnin